MIRLRLPALTLAVVGLLSLGACIDTSGPQVTGPQVIEETNFAASLEIDLATMTQTASGLYIGTILEGTGDPSAAGDTVSVLYEGFLSDGGLFDSSDLSGPFTFTLGAGVSVAGFDEGVTGMKVGGTRQIIIPPSLGYGNQQVGAIPPGSILVFNLELVSIN